MPPDFDRYRVEVDEEVTLADLDPADTASYDDADEEERSLLVVLQGIDAAGKDSTVKHVFSGTNPQGVRVYSFKEPSNEEAAHDFLWRYHQHTPGRGMIHVFNRSHYEDVLVVRVKELVEEETILKFFLHISKDAQLDRFRERLEREDKHYKFSANDVRERRNWDAYEEAYQDALRATSTEWAPWYVIPSDHKWFRNLTVGRIVTAMLHQLDPRWPEPEEDLEQFAADELEPGRRA